MPFSTRKSESLRPARRSWPVRAMDSLPVCAAVGAFAGFLISLLFM